MTREPLRHESAIIGALFAAAFILRVAPSFVPSFWFDEVYTVALSAHDWSEIVTLTGRDAHPPLYYGLVHILMRMGEFAGGPFASMAWLRWASIVPGLMTVGVAWFFARRAGGARFGLLVLGLFALSPALAYFSLELRGYSLAVLGLVASTLLLVEILDGRLSHPVWPVAAYSASALIALYANNLSILYLLFHIGLFAFELQRGASRRRYLLARGLPAALAVTLLYAPWLPMVFRQQEYLQSVEGEWMTVLPWHEIVSAYCFDLPLGSLGSYIQPAYWSGWRLAAVIAVAAFYIALGAGVWRDRKERRDRDGASNRFFAISAVMAFGPLTLAFLLSWTGVARVFATVRYNLLAAGFWALFIAAAIASLRGGRLRQSLGAIALAAAASASIASQARRPFVQRDTEFLLGSPLFDHVERPARIVWLNPRLMPWLGRGSGIDFISLDEALGVNAPREKTEPLWLLQHDAIGPYSSNPMMHWRTALARQILMADPGATMMEPGMLHGPWTGLWRVEPEAVSRVRRGYQEISMRIKSGTEVDSAGRYGVIPTDAIASHGEGWSTVEFSVELRSFVWTVGPLQRLSIRTPLEPGRYRAIMRFWRPHPFPEPRAEIRYRMPGSKDWGVEEVEVGRVDLSGEIEITRKEEKLSFELSTPTWRPSDYLPGSRDGRALGMMLLGIDFEPMEPNQ